MKPQDGIHVRRLRPENGGSATREEVFATQWRQQQVRGLLEMLLLRDAAPGEPGAILRVSSGLGPLYVTKPLGEPTERDAIVAATVMQWLGTNVGFNFLEETLKKAGYQLTTAKRYTTR